MNLNEKNIAYTRKDFIRKATAGAAGLSLGLSAHRCTAARKFSDPSVRLNIEDLGAKGDREFLNTEIIQKAIDHVSHTGGGSVVIPEGIFLTGTVFLKNNVDLHLCENAVLQGSIHLDHYQNIDEFIDGVGAPRGNCLVGAVGVRNVSLTGKGKIDGRGQMFIRDELQKRADVPDVSDWIRRRPFLVRFVRSGYITISGLNLVRSAAWTCHMFQCETILVENLSIKSRVNSNNDGIDLDSSANALIRNCDIDSGDDSIVFKSTSPKPCENVTVEHCRLSSNWGAVKFGTESMGDFKNITIRDCYLHNIRGGGFKLLSVDGSNMENLLIENIRMDQVDMPLFIRLGRRLNTYRDAPRQEIGSIQGVTIRNIYGTAMPLDRARVEAPSAIFITGIPSHRVRDVLIENFRILLPGGGVEAMAGNKIEEQETRYPEYTFFGTLPAYGVYVRHAENIDFKEVTIHVLADDCRHSVWLENVRQINTDGLVFTGETDCSLSYREISVF